MSDAIRAFFNSFGSRLVRLMPGIFPVGRARVVSEIFAGISLAAMNIPQALGYAKMAGVPVVSGLYTLLFPVIAFALLGGSRYLFVAADSATAVILFHGLSPMEHPGSPEFLELTVMVAMLTGALLLLARILRLGFLADFMSRTVLIGFLTGVGFQVSITMLGQMLGIHVPAGVPCRQLLFVLGHLSEASLPTLFLSLSVLSVMVSARRTSPRFPSALLAVLGSIIASRFWGFGGRGIEVIGAVEAGLPRFILPHFDWNQVEALLPVAGACFVMIITQSAATARAFGIKHRMVSDENRDLLGLGSANLVAGLTGTFVVNGSPTQTALLESCGGRSQLANLGTAATVALVLLLLTGWLRFLPLCVLGVVVFLVALRMIDLRGFRELRACGGKEFPVALFTALSVILCGVECGISLALIISLLEHVRRGYLPRTAVIVRDPEIHWRMEKAEPGNFIEPGVILYWFGTDLYYANAPYFCEEIRRILKGSPGTRALIVDCGPITSMDFTAGKSLAELQAECAERGITLALARVTEGLRRDLDRQRLSIQIGEKNIFRSRKHAVAAFRG